MKFYSFNKSYPTTLPNLIKSTDGTYRPRDRYSEEELLELGYVEAPRKPQMPSIFHTLKWDGENWQVVEMNSKERRNFIDITWGNIRSTADIIIKDIQWRIRRNESEIRLGIQPTEDVESLKSILTEVNEILSNHDPEDPFSIKLPAIEIKSDEF